MRAHVCTRVGLDVSVYRVCAQAYLSVYPAGGGPLNLMGYVSCVATLLFSVPHLFAALTPPVPGYRAP